MRAPGGGEGEPLTPWRLAGYAAGLIAMEARSGHRGRLGGAIIRGPAGPVRDAWLARIAELSQREPRRMPVTISDERLLGGVDLAATLASGRPVFSQGLLRDAAGGLLVAPMAERLPRDKAALVGLALDREAPFSFIACDEGQGDDEAVAPVLGDRLALMVDLSEVSPRDIAAWALTPALIAEGCAAADPIVPDEAIASLCQAAEALGIGSMRTSIQALAAARGLARLGGHTIVAAEDLAIAAALVLAPRATRLPAPRDAAEMDEEPPAANDPPAESEQPASDDETGLVPPEDLVLAAAASAIPRGLLAALAAGLPPRGRGAGKAGAVQKQARRGRVVGSRRGDPASGIRVDVVETLRAAAPWQTIRRRDLAGVSSHRPAVLVRREDFRVARYRQRSETTTIFLVDASGSTALQRLAEAKGAVRLLLAECYVRRDQVALIAFRKAQADLILSPTRSLVAAERALGALPGGGGTPLAAGLDAARRLITQVRREGRSVTLVVMSDGSANVTRDGQGGRARAHEDALAAARLVAAEGTSNLFIDTAAQPLEKARAIAAAMGARYIPLPYAQAAEVSRLVAGALPGAR